MEEGWGGGDGAEEERTGRGFSGGVGRGGGGGQERRTVGCQGRGWGKYRSDKLTISRASSCPCEVRKKATERKKEKESKKQINHGGVTWYMSSPRLMSCWGVSKGPSSIWRKHLTL